MIEKWKKQFYSQRNGAKTRSIEWKFTFQEWIDWWGKDIDRRGKGHDKLQMQRYGDKGAYEPGNVKKGYPQENRATWGRVAATKKANKAKIAHEKFLDALMWAASKEDKDPEMLELYEKQSEIASGSMEENERHRRHAFVQDKR